VLRAVDRCTAGEAARGRSQGALEGRLAALRRGGTTARPRWRYRGHGPEHMIHTKGEFEELARSRRPDDLERLRRDAVSWEAAIAIRQSESDVRAWLVLNKSIGGDVLRRYADDDDVRVRSFVARRRAANTETLALLASDADVSVRAAVAWNPGTPAHVLDQLENDGEEIVRAAVRGARLKRLKKDNR